MSIKISNSKVLYILIMLMPFVDIITGVALNIGIGGPFSALGQLYRMFSFVFMFYIIIVVNKAKKSSWLLPFTVYVFFCVVVNFIRFRSDIVEDLSYTIKLLFPLYLTVSLVIISKYDKCFIKKIYDSFSWIYPLSFVVPKFLGLGYYSYSNQSGYKAFYFANNEVNVILMVLFVYSFEDVFNIYIKRTKGKNFKSIIRLILIVFSLLLIGSKTSILAIAIVFLVYIFKEKKFKLKKRYILILLVISVFGFFMMKIFIGEQINRAIERITFFYYFYTTGSSAEDNSLFENIITFLCSERNLRVMPSFDYWYKQDMLSTICNIIFGIGKSTKSPDSTNIWINPFSIIELDLFECLFWFGAISTMIVMVFYVSIYFKSLKRQGLFMEKTMFVLVFMFSMFAGHVLVAANSGTIFAIVVADLSIKSNLKMSTVIGV